MPSRLRTRGHFFGGRPLDRVAPVDKLGGGGLVLLFSGLTNVCSF